MEIVTMYEQLGVSRAVYEYGEAVLRDLRSWPPCRKTG